MKEKFICPIPWVSLSLGAKSTPRLCCHQETESSYLPTSPEDLIQLKHNREVRDKFQRGEIPHECHHCLSLEEKGCNSPRLDYLKRFSFDAASEVNPLRYIDITIDNDCNLECIMCSPIYSYKLSRVFEGQFKMPPTAKWSTNLEVKEIIQNTPHLEQLTITGGEPFISPKSKSFIREFTSHPNVQNITLRVFTNFTLVDSSLLRQLSKFKKVELILSIDSVEENYELIRFPAKWNTIISNIEKLKSLKLPHLDIHLHAVITAVNWPKLGELIKFYGENLSGYSILPVFVEIGSPLLHPRVLSEEQYQQGLAATLDSLTLLRPRNTVHQQQIEDFKKLLIKIGDKNYQNHYIDFKVYLKKITSFRHDAVNAKRDIAK